MTVAVGLTLPINLMKYGFIREIMDSKNGKNMVSMIRIVRVKGMKMIHQYQEIVMIKILFQESIVKIQSRINQNQEGQ